MNAHTRTQDSLTQGFGLNCAPARPRSFCFCLCFSTPPTKRLACGRKKKKSANSCSWFCTRLAKSTREETRRVRAETTRTGEKKKLNKTKTTKYHTDHILRFRVVSCGKYLSKTVLFAWSRQAFFVLVYLFVCFPLPTPPTNSFVLYVCKHRLPSPSSPHWQ